MNFLAAAAVPAPSAPSLAVPHVAYSAIAPEIVLIVGSLILLGVAAMAGKRLPRGYPAGFTCLVAIVALLESLRIWSHVVGAGHHGYTVIDSAIAVDGFSALFLILISIALLLSMLGGQSFLSREKMEGPEFPVLLMLSASGAMLMAEANDLIVLFLGLEIMSIALYVLAGSNLRRTQSGEAAIKYFVLGAFSSAIFLYGIALVYGSTGSTNLALIGSFLSSTLILHNGVLLAGIALLIAGLAFKIAAVPFHTWAPDVYQGAPTPAVSFMAAVAKAGGFAGLLRLLYSAFQTQQVAWVPIVWALAVLSLVVGAILALVQRDVKRMLAYSSISHAGFVLVGLAAATSAGIAGSLYYLFAYTFMVIGSFTVVQVVGGAGDSRHDLEDYRGLARRQPFLAVAMTVFLLAQAGAPFTIGFIAKFSVVAAVVDAHSYVLALIAMISAAIAAFFYLRVVGYMFSSEGDAKGAAGDSSDENMGRLRVPVGPAVVIALCAGVTVVFGIWAGPLLDFARHATLYF